MKKEAPYKKQLIFISHFSFEKLKKQYKQQLVKQQASSTVKAKNNRQKCIIHTTYSFLIYNFILFL